MSQYQQKLDATLLILREHNDAIGQTDGKHNPGYVNPEEVISCLKATGCTNDDRLRAAGYEEIEACLPAYNGIKPRTLAKEIAKVFRGKEEAKVGEGADKRSIGGRRVETMSPRELVEALDPEEFDNAVARRLKSMSRGQAFIVYAESRTIDFQTTLQLLMEVKSGHSGRNDITVENKVKKVYTIGELPDNFADENPLYVGRPLRPDGTCDQTARSWMGVPLEIRQIVRLALSTGELKNVDIEKAHAVIDVAVAPDAEEKLRQRYRKASIKFDEDPVARPLLKIQLGKAGGNGRPFDDGKKVVWAANPNLSNSYAATYNEQPSTSRDYWQLGGKFPAQCPKK